MPESFAEAPPTSHVITFAAGLVVGIVWGRKLLEAVESLLGPSTRDLAMARRLERSGVKVKKRYRRKR